MTQAPQEKPALKGLPVNAEPKAHRDLPVKLVPKGSKATRATKGQPDPKAPPATEVHRDHVDRKEQPGLSPWEAVPAAVG